MGELREKLNRSINRASTLFYFNSREPSLDHFRLHQAIHLFTDMMRANGFYLKQLDESLLKLISEEEYEKRLNEKYNIKGIRGNINSLLLPKDILVFNRNENGEKSNFFVIVRVSKRKMEVIFSDPLGPEQRNCEGKRGVELEQEEFLRRFVFTSFKNREEAEKAFGVVVSSIKEAASHKPEDAYYAQMHSHWGTSRGRSLLKLHIDDGSSKYASENRVIFNLLLNHTDIDATGHHNNFFDLFYDDVNKVERALGIIKVPSMELSLPFGLYRVDVIKRFLKEFTKNRDDFQNFLFDNFKKGDLKVEEMLDILNNVYGMEEALGKLVKNKKEYISSSQLTAAGLFGLLPLVSRYNESIPKSPFSKMFNSKKIYIPHQDLNGIHMMLYASSPDILKEVHRDYLRHRSNASANYPPFCSEVELLEFLSEVTEKHKDNIAFVLSHPAGSLLLPKSVSLITFLIGSTEYKDVEKIFDHIQGVCCFNLSLPSLHRLRFPKEDEDYFLIKAIMEAYKEEVGSVPTTHALNMAFALFAKSTYGLFPCFEADAHTYPSFNSSKILPGPFGAGRTVFARRKISSQKEFIRTMHNYKMNAKLDSRHSLLKALQDFFSSLEKYKGSKNKENVLLGLDEAFKNLVKALKENHQAKPNTASQNIYAEVYHTFKRENKGIPEPVRKSKAFFSLYLEPLKEGLGSFLRVIKDSSSNNLVEFFYAFKAIYMPLSLKEFLRQKASDVLFGTYYAFGKLFKKLRFLRPSKPAN